MPNNSPNEREIILEVKLCLWKNPDNSYQLGLARPTSDKLFPETLDEIKKMIIADLDNETTVALTEHLADAVEAEDDMRFSNFMNSLFGKK